MDIKSETPLPTKAQELGVPISAVLIAEAVYRNSDWLDDYGWCFLSKQQIAEMTGYTIQTVFTALKDLELAGFLEREGRQIRLTQDYLKHWDDRGAS
jgi:CRP-like cAMP-binding protein